MRLPVYLITYQCRKCATHYIGKWDPNQPGHIEPATACPSCSSPVRLFRGVTQAPGTAGGATEAATLSRLGPTMLPVSGARGRAVA
jgi:hypothetical protein